MSYLKSFLVLWADYAWFASKINVGSRGLGLYHDYVQWFCITAQPYKLYVLVFIALFWSYFYIFYS